ncbi:unnamed protein product [Paramecium sonneborni]|uniref:Uncharacterized protein n=1 Tax=Paramecium sonneborni TaxID=65129 RepID=A0A8S1LDQ9_9CILI|nr:unnamed protein product [Paramecium sonneborni]
MQITLNQVIGKYDLQLRRCLDTKQQNLGCSPYLNKEACINQMSNFQGEKIYCVFFERCQYIEYAEIQKLGCDDRLNKLACMNLSTQKCFWENKCKIIQEDIKNNSHNYEQFSFSVTPYTCQLIESGLCKHKFLNSYQ